MTGYRLQQQQRPQSVLLGAGAGVAIVRQVEMSLCALCGEDDHADHTAGTAVPLDGLSQRALDKVDALLLGHALLPVCVAVAVDVG